MIHFGEGEGTCIARFDVFVSYNQMQFNEFVQNITIKTLDDLKKKRTSGQ